MAGAVRVNQALGRRIDAGRVVVDPVDVGSCDDEIHIFASNDIVLACEDPKTERRALWVSRTKE